MEYNLDKIINRFLKQQNKCGIDILKKHPEQRGLNTYQDMMYGVSLNPQLPSVAHIKKETDLKG